ncbi:MULTISPECIES: helix-turn-helix domain-containing protein [unclassified Streptomyces]|uniref:helix-turn-helix domain-containing protein n=1 Tax=unclassified Streptomyces TaxID=2593676 RepID=UPI000DC7A40B|nr:MULTISPECIES: helix-turn-helix domain-containing protein [unclassified Streptomyces]AWZ05988.1 AraC family transcriptional regulator [Streptomyces sp. ICC4]AWZ13540.1 AraC family transcriptional regulator [Streptomyces sp. ICC1]
MARNGQEAASYSRRLAPSPALRGIVSGYSAYAYAGGVVRRRLVVPNTIATVDFGFGAPVRTLGMAGDRSYSTAASRADLPATVAVRAEHEGDVRGVVVRMPPMGAYRLFGVPMSQWRQPHLDPVSLLPRTLRHLPEMLAHAPAGERLRLLDAALAPLLDRGARVSPEVMWAWHELHRVRGRIRVGRLAADTLWSVRHLERRFREQIGHSPAAIARILRFTNALRLQKQGLPLARVADLAGFHDQAHFHHTVRAVTGMTPTQFLRGGRIEWNADSPPEPAAPGLPADGRVSGPPR